MNKLFKMLNMIGPSQVLFVGKHTVFLESNLYQYRSMSELERKKYQNSNIYNFIINYLKPRKLSLRRHSNNNIHY